MNKPTESPNSNKILLKTLKRGIVSRNPTYKPFLFESPIASLLYLIYFKDIQMKKGKYNTAEIIYASKIIPPLALFHLNNCRFFNSFLTIFRYMSILQLFALNHLLHKKIINSYSY